MTKAIYAGSFDPFTNGHLWMVEQATKLFDGVIVAIAENSNKKPNFPLYDKIESIKESIKDLPHVRVTHFRNQFIVDYAKANNIQYLLRGIRCNQDYEYEKMMRHVNAEISSDPTSVFLMAPKEMENISSSMVMSFIGLSGWTDIVKQHVPKPVYEMMRSYHLEV